MGFDGYYDPKDYFESFTTGRSPDTSVMPSSLENKTNKNTSGGKFKFFFFHMREKDKILNFGKFFFFFFLLNILKF